MHKKLRLAAILGLSVLASGCWSLAPGARPYDDLKYPGYFDIGAGWARVIDTQDSDDDDAEGTMISFKAYPFGRWYGELRDDLANQLSAANRNLLGFLVVHVEQRAEAMAKVPKLEASTLNDWATLKPTATGLNVAQKAMVTQAASDKTLKETDVTELEKAAKGAKPKSVQEFVQGLVTHHKKKNEALAAVPKLSKETKDAALNLVNNPNAKLQFSQREIVKRVANGEELQPNDLAQLRQAANGGDSKKWYIVEERDCWWNRFAVFYGRSVGDFDSGGLTSEVNALGIAFDISPDLSLQFGRGFFEGDNNGQIDSDSSWYYGVSLNLNSFRQFAAALAGLAE